MFFSFWIGECIILAVSKYRGRTKERVIACSLINENRLGSENLETDFIGFMSCISV